MLKTLPYCYYDTNLSYDSYDIKSPTAYCEKEIRLQVPMHPEGIEPPAPEPESGVLSVKLWVPFAYFFELNHCTILYFKKQKNFLFFAFYLQFNLFMQFFCLSCRKILLVLLLKIQERQVILAMGVSLFDILTNFLSNVLWQTPVCGNHNFSSFFIVGKSLP